MSNVVHISEWRRNRELDEAHQRVQAVFGHLGPRPTTRQGARAYLAEVFRRFFHGVSRL